MNDVLPTLNRVIGWVAFAIAICAALKMFDFHIPLPGSVTENGIVAAALALAPARL